MKEEIEKNYYQSFNTVWLMVIRGRVLTEVSNDDDTPAQHRERGRPFTHKKHVPRISLPRNSFCDSLGLFFHLKSSKFNNKTKIKVDFYFGCYAHTKPMLV